MLPAVVACSAFHLRPWAAGNRASLVRHANNRAIWRNLVRVFAPVFAWNRRSMRVLERNGYAREAVLRRAGVKDGVVIDRVVDARTRASDYPYAPYAPAPEDASRDA